MKKIGFIFFVLAVLATSCEKKTTEKETLSGLWPSKFDFSVEREKNNRLYILKNTKGMEVTVINIGARIVSIIVPDKVGKPQNIVLGYDSITPYLQADNYLGAVIGRYANCIAGETIELDRVTYHLRLKGGEKNIFHGGPRGFSSQYFTIEQPNEQSVVCTYFSKDGEEGFPGNLTLTVTYTVTDNNSLDIDYRATTDRATYVNFTNQSYFNLSGKMSHSLADHQLLINASGYTPVNENAVPTGEIAKLNASINYTVLKAINTDQKYNLNYVLNNSNDINRIAAKAVSSSTGINLEVYTTEPGIQLYTDPNTPSFCLETQHFPDSPHHPNFPTTVLRVDSVFNSKTIYKFGIEN
jgi:aldose 1-epimerase